MDTIISLTACLLAVLVSCNAQFSLPLDSNECALGKLLDPLLAQSLKSKYPKKYSSKLGFEKDLIVNSKYRLGAEKLLARHLKNLNAVNQDLQKLMYHNQQQQCAMQPLTVSSNQVSLSPQQQYLTKLKNHYDARQRFTFYPTADMSALPQFSQQRFQHFQQPAYHLTGTPGVQSMTSLRPQQIVYQPGCALQM